MTLERDSTPKEEVAERLNLSEKKMTMILIKIKIVNVLLNI